MIQLIVGGKGSGKTKTIIEMMNEAAANTDGHIVCIEKGMKSTFNVKPDVRVIDIDTYNVRGTDQYFGFIMGVLAGDYDIEQVFLDGSLKVVGTLENYVTLLDKVSDIAPEYVKFVFTVSAENDELPEGIRKYLEND